LGTSPEEAEKLKLAEVSGDQVAAVVGEYNVAIADEINRTLDYAMTQTQDTSIQGVYVCGGASRTEGLFELLQEKISAPLQALNPVQNIAGSGKKMNAQAIREISFLGAVAIGLALRTTGDCK